MFLNSLAQQPTQDILEILDCLSHKMSKLDSDLLNLTSLEDLEKLYVIQTRFLEANHRFNLQMAKQLIELQQANTRLYAEIHNCQQAQVPLRHLAELGELAAMIVHEVRNPLTTILMGLESFQKIQLAEWSQQRLLLALEEAERLKHLLNEILLFAKPQPLNCCEFEVNNLIANMNPLIKSIPAVEKCRIEVLSMVSEVWILGDQQKLKQIFINLIKNACEAVEPGTLITWRIEPEQKDNRVCISVHNPGTPIPAEILAKLGMPFFSTKPSGNGLGLAIVKRLVEAHKGQMIITSNNVGTTVTVQLPILLKANTRRNSYPSAPVTRRKW